MKSCFDELCWANYELRNVITRPSLLADVHWLDDMDVSDMAGLDVSDHLLWLGLWLLLWPQLLSDQFSILLWRQLVLRLRQPNSVQLYNLGHRHHLNRVHILAHIPHLLFQRRHPHHQEVWTKICSQTKQYHHQSGYCFTNSSHSLNYDTYFHS